MALSTRPPLKAQTKIQVAVNFHQPKTPKTTDGFLYIKLAASYWNRQVTLVYFKDQGFVPHKDIQEFKEVDQRNM